MLTINACTLPLVGSFAGVHAELHDIVDMLKRQEFWFIAWIFIKRTPW